MSDGDIDNDDFLVEINLDSEFVGNMLEFFENAPPMAVSAWVARTYRRIVFDSVMESIGGLTNYRRKTVVRALVKMFRAGYSSGRMSRSFETEEATDGQSS